MLFFGHIAVSVALADATDADPSWAIAGNLLPDMTDKAGAWVFRIMPSGRWLAHGLPFFAAASLAATRLLPERAARGFVIGYASHLAGDLYAGGRLPLAAPFMQAPSGHSSHGLSWLGVNLVPELLGLAFLFYRNRRRVPEGLP
jgi:hypothetical protein